MSSNQPAASVARTAKIGARVAMLIVLSMVAGVVVAGALLPLVAGVGLSAKAASNDFEALSTTFVTPPLSQQSEIYASDNKTKIATIYYQNRIEVRLSQVAPVMRQALVAVEDGRFYQHNGFDIRGFLRAAVGTSSGGQVQGGSTLTQQYVKQVLINAATTPAQVQEAQARTLTRKIKELRYALAIEKEFSKDQILERYLNIAYFGGGAYGVEAASRRYFNIHASQLSLVQAATLAGLVQQPIAYNPINHPNHSQSRRKQVLTRMADQGYISTKVAVATAAIPTKSFLHPRTVPSNCTSSWAPFFCDYAIHVIKNDPAFGATSEAREALLRTGGLRIVTTLDPRIQQQAVTAVTDKIPIRDKSGKVAALSMVQPGTGKILAMAQNRLWGTKGVGFTTYNFNVGTAYGGSQGAQAGSTFKPFTMAAALEQGISPYQIINSPYQQTFPGLATCDGSGQTVQGATIHNDSTGLNGPMNMLTGTALSVNTYYMGLEQLTGLCDPIKVATALGVKRGNGNPVGVNLNFTLGVDEVTPLTMAEAYATFANHGTHCDSVAIISVTTRDGNPLPIPSPNCQSVLPREVADSVTAILSQDIDGPVAGRTGQGMSLGRQAAGKTGTINGSAAVWFAGYTPEFAAAVWTGDPRGGFGHPMQDITINGIYYSQVFGLSIPGPIWQQTMLAALGTSPKTPFDLQTLDGLGVYVPPPPVITPVSPSPSGSPSPGASVSPSPGASTPPPSPSKPPASPGPKPGGAGG